MSLGPYKYRHLLILQRPVFTYTEWNDNLSLCVIQDILEFAFLDDAFTSERIKEPRDIWRFTHVPGHRLSTPLHFKESVKYIPIFRRAIRNSEDNWITDATQAFQYEWAQEYNIATSKSAGFKKNPSSLYEYRKGAANLSKEYLSLKLISIDLFLQGIQMSIPVIIS